MAKKKLDIKEFKDHGYLQEANRLFFHPLGLALEVKEINPGQWVLSSLWDCRDDPEGFIYDEEYISSDKAREKEQRVTTEWLEKGKTRFKAFGFVTQPISEIEEIDMRLRDLRKKTDKGA